MAKGSTTIDGRGATRGCGAEGAAAIPGADAGFIVGQIHHAPAATISAAAAVVAIAVTVLRRRRGAAIGTLDAGRSAMASGRSAKTRTGRAIFLTLCSPLSSSG